ncbi:hypothetical protein CYMTET_27827 [Cymbomonas tetramitiformis]|uniref:Ion transport domain-containing protein n=1 Tax=Cymbomonas tetramitiformis TaxID=36881 RepID=A0AAE0FP54_9CHLO|nr:hypothetical protein CYMTET_27827 [Cymbomonas tetramitiformis]
MSRVYLSDDEDGVANDDKEPEQKDAEEEEEEEVLRWFGELSEDEVEVEDDLGHGRRRCAGYGRASCIGGSTWTAQNCTRNPKLCAKCCTQHGGCEYKRHGEAEMTGFTTWEDQSATTTKSETSDGRLDFATGSDIGLTGIVLAEEIEPFATEVRRNPLVMASADPIGMPSLNRVRTASATKSTGAENSNLHGSQFPPASTGLKWVHSSPPEASDLLFGSKQGVKVRKITQERPSSLVIMPDGQFRRAWDISQAVILLYLAITVPYRVAFNQPAMGVMFCIELLQDCFFYVDIGLNFFTGYYDRASEVVTNLPSVQRNYVTTWFTIDIVACLPIDLTQRIVANKFWCSLRPSGCTSDVNSVQLIRMIKLLRIFKLLKLLRLIRVCHPQASSIRRPDAGIPTPGVLSPPP